MTAYSWPPEQLEAIEAKIKAAREGDVGAAASLLVLLTDCLEEERPIPDPLRLYLIGALREITQLAAPSKAGAGRIIHAVVTDKHSLRDWVERSRATGDANKALNLTRRRGRMRPAIDEALTNIFIGVRVLVEMEKGQSWEDATATVAERLGFSSKTVIRAWSKVKGQLKQTVQPPK